MYCYSYIIYRAEIKLSHSHYKIYHSSLRLIRLVVWYPCLLVQCRRVTTTLVLFRCHSWGLIDVDLLPKVSVTQLSVSREHILLLIVASFPSSFVVTHVFLLLMRLFAVLWPKCASPVSSRPGMSVKMISHIVLVDLEVHVFISSRNACACF